MARNKTRTALHLAERLRCSEGLDSLVLQINRNQPSVTNGEIWGLNSKRLHKEKHQRHWWWREKSVTPEQLHNSWNRRRSKFTGVKGSNRSTAATGCLSTVWLFETFIVEYEFYDFILFLQKLSLRFWKQFPWLYIFR